MATATIMQFLALRHDITSYLPTFLQYVTAHPIDMFLKYVTTCSIFFSQGTKDVSCFIYVD